MDKVKIIGGGITGVAISQILNNFDPVIFEASTQLGGILKDYKVNEFIFFSGCQYFNGNSRWFDLISSSSEFYEFEHRYASFTDIFENTIALEGFAGPIYSGIFPQIKNCKNHSLNSLKDRLNLYPHFIASSLKNWFQFIGIDIDTTHHSATVGFQASRVYMIDHEEAVKKMKNENHISDLIYGLPRNFLKINNVNAFLPSKGFDIMFEDVFKKNHFNSFFLRNPVRPIFNGKRINILSKDEVIDSDLFVWTSDPNPLIYAVTGKKLESQKFKAEIIVGTLDEPVNIPFYIQVYSLKSRVLRIFVYNMNGQGRFTIEKARDKQTTKEVIEFSQNILANFMNHKFMYTFGRKQEIRYFAITTKDYKILDDFQKNHGIKNLILPNYLLYGRDQKIDSIILQL